MISRACPSTGRPAQERMPTNGHLSSASTDEPPPFLLSHGSPLAFLQRVSTVPPSEFHRRRLSSFAIRNGRMQERMSMVLRGLYLTYSDSSFNQVPQNSPW